MSKKNDLGKRLVESFDEKLPDWKCTGDNWRTKNILFREQCRQEDETGLTLLQSRWEAGIGRDQDMCDEIIEDSKTPLDALSSLLEFGLIPPPEILLTLDEMHRTYKMSFGYISAEEAFFGKPIKGKGSYGLRRFFSKDKKYEHFDFWRKIPRIKEQDLSLVEQAEMFLSDPKVLERHESYKNIDLDSFLRQYRRWRNKQQG